MLISGRDLSIWRRPYISKISAVGVFVKLYSMGEKVYNIEAFYLVYSGAMSVRKWRNWQTRKPQELIADYKAVWVQVPPSAPEHTGDGSRERAHPRFFEGRPAHVTRNKFGDTIRISEIKLMSPNRLKCAGLIP